MSRPSWILGITGGIGSGKSTVAEAFSRQGIHVVDSDQAARWVVEPGRPALVRIVERFGPEILLPDGQLNRAALRQRIFNDPEQRRWLEALLHPLVNQEVRQNLQQASSPYAILVSPLLIESGQRAITQRLLVVDVPVELQIQRTMARDSNSEDQVRAIIAAQIARDERLRHADDVLLNNQDLQQVEKEVERLHRFYLQLKGGQP